MLPPLLTWLAVRSRVCALLRRPPLLLRVPVIRLTAPLALILPWPLSRLALRKSRPPSLTNSPLPLSSASLTLRVKPPALLRLPLLLSRLPALTSRVDSLLNEPCWLISSPLKLSTSGSCARMAPPLLSRRSPVRPTPCPLNWPRVRLSTRCTARVRLPVANTTPLSLLSRLWPVMVTSLLLVSSPPRLSMVPISSFSAFVAPSRPPRLSRLVAPTLTRSVLIRWPFWLSMTCVSNSTSALPAILP
ncbi:hypothetical protein D3C81_528430 [compost metagenome]